MAFLLGLGTSIGGAAIGSALAPSGGQQGSGFQAQSAPLNQPLTSSDVANSVNNQNAAIAQQQALNQQLAGQGGIANQSSVFNQQQGLANQLGIMAQGGGPNPALAQLNQTTGQNVQNQAALMAGQRGAGANAGLIARQAAQQGAATQQQAVGQAATERQQQQLAAIGALQNQQQALGQTAGQQVGQQIGGVGALNAQQANLSGQLMGGLQGQNAQTLQNISQQNQYNEAMAQQNAAAQHQAIAGGISGASSALSQGGGDDSEEQFTPSPSGGSAMPGASELMDAFAQGGMIPPQSGQEHPAAMYAQGGQVANLKENYGPKSRIGKHFYASGGKVHNLKRGGHVAPGTKPKVGGAKDSYDNDTIDAKLSPGEIVLPRSVTKSSDPIGNGARFIASTLAKKGKR